MPLDRNSPVSSETGAYSPWDLNIRVGDRADHPGILEAAGASFRSENEAGAVIASEALNLEKREYFRVDPDYNPFANGDLEGYEEHADRFIEAQNATVVEAIKADIDREKRDRETVEAAGWTGIATDVFASVASPTTLLPGGALVKSGKVGYSGLRSAISVGAAAGGGALLQEGALHSVQQTRDLGESAYVVGGSIILGGLLGAGGAQLFSRGDWAKFSRAIEEDLADDTPHPSQVSQQIVRKLRSAGAASKDDIDAIDWEKELEIGGTRAAKAIAHATAAVRLNPGLELLTSPSMKSRSTFLRLAENHVGTAGELEGRTLGPAAETAMKRYSGNLATFIAKRREAFKQARNAGFKGKLPDFDAAVARATRRGDVDPDGNEFVTTVAQSWRNDVANPLKDEAVDVRLLPEGVKVTTAPSYLYRMYDRGKILAGEGRFRGVLKRYIRSEVDRAIARQEEIEIAKKINRATDLEEELSQAQDRLGTIETRLDKRGQVRAGKLAAIERKESQRFDLLRGRVPESVIAAAKQARDDDVMVRSVKEVSRPAKAGPKRPVLGLLKQMGGVKVGSYLDQELRNMGVTPRTAPGVQSKTGQLSAVDNLVAREHELLARFQTDQNGYADPDEILAAIRDEMAGVPIRTDDELGAEAARDVLEANVENWLSEMGLPANATAKEVREHLDRALRNEGKLSGLDQSIGRMAGELEELDRATDKIANERVIAEAAANKFADDLNELEAKINEVRQFANASPQVKILVDYADARKAYGKGRYDQARVENRIEAIERAISETEAQFPDGDIVGSGDFGPIINAKAYKGNWRLLIERLRSLEDGEAHGALQHSDIGPIDLTWGSYDPVTQNGHGLAKILQKHPEVVDDLPSILASTKVVSKSENRVRLGNDQYSAVVRLEFDGKQKTWLLTAFEKKGKGQADATQGLRGSEAVANGKQQSFRSSANAKITSGGPDFQSIEDLRAELRALRADRNKVAERVTRAKAKVEKLKPMLPKDRAEELDFGDVADLDGYVDEIVAGTFDKIMGKQVEDVPDWMVPVSQGPLKGRTLHIPDEMVEEFLVNDMEMIARRYVRQMSSEVELTRAFGRADMKDQIKEIQDDYAQLRANTSDAKELRKLDARERADVAHIEAFRDMLRGTYRAAEERKHPNWAAMTRLALSWNFIRLLGGVTLSSLPDIANVMTRQGLRSFMDDGLTGLVSSTKAAKIAKRDAREWGAVTETVLQTRLAELAELHDPYAAGTVADRLMGNVTSVFSRLTFLDRWNDTMKTIVTLQAGNKIARLTRGSLADLPDKWGVVGRQASFAKLSKHERGYLGKLGIDENMATRIADQVDKYGLEENGIWGLNLRAWDDKEARRVIGAALAKEADGGVVTPGIADKPLWARSNTGKLAMQFKSFGLAAHQRILLSRLQGRQKHLAEFLVFGTALGMMVSYLKFIERGDFEAAERLADNPGLWIADGFDRTGIATVLMEVSNIGEKLDMPFGVKSAAQMLAGDEDRGADVSRFASRNALGAFFGPTVGTIQDLVTIGSQVANRDINSEGARAITRQIPFGTLPGVRTLIQTTVKPALENAAN